MRLVHYIWFILLAVLIVDGASAESVQQKPVRTVSHIAFPEIPGWKSSWDNEHPESAVLVHLRSGAVIRAQIVPLRGMTLKQLASKELAMLQASGYEIVTSTCCSTVADARIAWSAYVPLGLDKKQRTRGHRRADPASRRGAIVVRAVKDCADIAVVIVATWDQHDHVVLENDVQQALDGIELR